MEIVLQVLEQASQEAGGNLIDTSKNAKYSLRGGARSSLSRLRRAIREIVRSEQQSKTVHTKIAETINSDAQHSAVMKILHTQDAELARRRPGSDQSAVLWISPFQTPALYWTEETVPDYVRKTDDSYIFRVVCGATRRNVMVVEGVRNVSHRTTHCFATKYPISTVPVPPAHSGH